MFSYRFPAITDIEQVRAAIAGREEFIEADKGDYIVFNYLVNFEDTFPPVYEVGRNIGKSTPHYYNVDAAIRRECRGLIFDKATGKVIARRYHKFFNYGEKPETRDADFNKIHFILEKLDGSMITPFRTSAQTDIDGIRFHVGTKMGVTDVSANAKMFIDEHENYQNFIMGCIEQGLTPIFEWCSRKNRIVVDYPEDRLVLTAIRDNVYGEYFSYANLSYYASHHKLDVVKAFDMDFDKARETLKTLEGEEGYIVRWGNGHMMKLKGDWYLQLHKTLEHVQHEKDLIRLILDEKLDDAKPFLPADLVSKLDNFGEAMFRQIRLFSNNLAWDCIADFDKNPSKKAFALVAKDKYEPSLRFKVFDWMYAETTDTAYVKEFTYQLVLKKIKDNLSSSGKVDGVRHLFGGLRWVP